MGFLFGRKNRGMPQNATFRLTEQGREKLQEFSGDPKSRILVALETGGSSDIDEISKASGLSKGQIERLVPAMIKGGYIQYITAGQSSEE